MPKPGILRYFTFLTKEIYLNLASVYAVENPRNCSTKTVFVHTFFSDFDVKKLPTGLGFVTVVPSDDSSLLIK